MAKEIALVARHSPMQRTRQTAELFMKGFAEEAARHSVDISFVKQGKKEGKEKLPERKALLPLPEASKALGKTPFPKDQTQQQREEIANVEFEKVEKGQESEYLISKEEVLSPKHFGLLLTSHRKIGRLAKLLAYRARFSALSPALRRQVAAEQAIVDRHTGGKPKSEEPTVVSIFMRHSKNDGDKLTEEGEELALAQGRETARHSIEHVLKNSKGKVRPTVVLYVSHGGSPKSKGPLDWVLEHKDVLGKPVEKIGGKLSQAEGLITLGYEDGQVKRLMLRQHGITNLH